MSILNKISSRNATLARRAKGAMFFSVFGAAWIIFWLYKSHKGSMPLFIFVAFVTLVMLGFSYQRYAQYKAELLVEVNWPKQVRIRRFFIIINAMQWLSIILFVNILTNKGFPDWILPSVILVVGIHFLPLAKLFSYPPHYVTGLVLILIAVIYPVLALDGPRDPVGCLATGLILWASAMWAVLNTQLRTSSQLTAEF